VNVVVAGGTGFIGRSLCKRLLLCGHRVTILTRRRTEVERLFGTMVKPFEWDGTSSGRWEEALQGTQAVVNLAGASIAEARWTESRKQLLTQSRLNATRALVQACFRLPVTPQVLINASGIGFYGHQDDRVVDEASPAGKGFLADLCVQWESAAQKAAAKGIRTVCLRTGLVLGDDGGALPRMVLPFRLFIGGPAGPGTQWVSWIHRDDYVGLIEWTLSTPSVSGPVNAVAPEPVTMTEFCRTLGQVLHRPSWIPVPEVVFRLALGELGSLMTTGQRVKPAKAEQGGYRFQYSCLTKALQNIFTLQ